MGLDINAVQFLIAARKRGVEFGEVLTLGRQDLNVFPATMRKALQRAGFPGDCFRAEGGDSMYAEPVFRCLGASRVYSMDVSTYEGASFAHDLNQPIPPELRERFDVVYDGGTLEHVFQFPTALRNSMEMVRGGGHLFLHTVANNYCGHGFYQFSPELFFRALSAENGFEVQRMVAHRMGPYGRWYEIQDPEQIRSRVELITLCPIQLLVQARRVRVVPIFEQEPQQSDYTPRWTDRPAGRPAVQVRYAVPRPALARVLPGVARLFNAIKIGWGMLQSHSLSNRRAFRRVSRRD